MAAPHNKYPTHVQPRLETIRAWRRDGLTEKEICKNLGVSTAAFANYKNQHLELIEVLKGGKDDAIAQVENAQFKAALGYEYEESKLIIEPRIEINKDGKKEQKNTITRVEKTKKQVQPNVTAQIFILKNRRSDKWNDRRGIDEQSGRERSSEEVRLIRAAMGELTVPSEASETVDKDKAGS